VNTSTMTTTQRTTDGTTMQAITQDRYGEAEDVLRLEEIARPAIGEEEVLLRVHAAGVDRGVWHLMTGLPYPVRLAGYGTRTPKTPVRGREAAGRVEATGPPSRRCTSVTRPAPELVNRPGRCGGIATPPLPMTRSGCSAARPPAVRARSTCRHHRL